MPKKQTKKPKYPKVLYVRSDSGGYLDCNQNPNSVLMSYERDDNAEIAIYKFDRMAKVKRTVTVE